LEIIEEKFEDIKKKKKRQKKRHTCTRTYNCKLSTVIIRGRKTPALPGGGLKDDPGFQFRLAHLGDRKGQKA
jgi:hypothetical protein